MIDFSLSDEERLLQQMVRELARKEIAPRAREWDEEERFPHEVMPRLAELGLLGMTVPEAYGGSAMTLQQMAIVLEEVARVDGGLTLTLASHNGLCTGHIARAGTESQKRRYLPRLASGQALGAWALTEPGSGSDAAALRTRAEHRPDGSWQLTGSKTFITQGSVASIYIILASTSPGQGRLGITAFIVEKGTPGLRVGRHLRKFGVRDSDTTEIYLEDCLVPAEAQLGSLGGGFLDALRILDRGRVAIAAMAVGLAQGALDAALTYARERRQFGQPLGSFQAIQFMLADSATEIEAARLLVRRAAWLHDHQRPATRESAEAKLWAARTATRVCDRAIQVHGGYGYTRDFPVERAARDAKLCELGEGTNEVQRMVIAREMLRSA